MLCRATALLAAAVVLGGCAHVATNEPGATIWVDGRPVGRSGRIWALGPPHQARVVVVAKDGRRARTVMGREFTWNTFEGGFYTMGLCFVLCWAYPEEVLVTLPPPRPRAESWDDDSWDAVWLAPPPNPAATASASRTAP